MCKFFLQCVSPSSWAIYVHVSQAQYFAFLILTMELFAVKIWLCHRNVWRSMFLCFWMYYPGILYTIWHLYFTGQIFVNSGGLWNFMISNTPLFNMLRLLQYTWDTRYKANVFTSDTRYMYMYKANEFVSLYKNMYLPQCTCTSAFVSACKCMQTLYLASDVYCILSKFVEKVLQMLLNSWNSRNLRPTKYKCYMVFLDAQCRTEC